MELDKGKLRLVAFQPSFDYLNLASANTDPVLIILACLLVIWKTSNDTDCHGAQDTIRKNTELDSHFLLSFSSSPDTDPSYLSCEYKAPIFYPSQLSFRTGWIV